MVEYEPVTRGWWNGNTLMWTIDGITISDRDFKNYMLRNFGRYVDFVTIGDAKRFLAERMEKADG